MKWLITGGCGFIGCNLADELLTQGNRVALLDNLSRSGSDKNLKWLRERHGEQFPFFQHDTRDMETVERTIIDWEPDVIAHLAGQVAATTSLNDPLLDFEINA